MFFCIYIFWWISLVQSVCRVASIDRERDGPVFLKEFVLLHQQGECAGEDGRIARVLDVDADHLGKHGWLRSVQVILPPTVGYESKVLDIIEEVLNLILRNLGEAAARPQQPLKNPVGIPIIRLPEPASGDDEGPLDGNKAALTFRADACFVENSRQISPFGNDFFHKLLVDRVVHVLEKRWIHRQIATRERNELGSSWREMCRQEVDELGAIL